MVQISQEWEKIRRAQETIKATDSPYLRRDLAKYIKRAKRQIKQAELFIQKSGARALEN